jgi:thioredoxin-dependent peroxiredoxin
VGKTNSGTTIHGKPIQVGGEALKEGQMFPPFKLTANDMSDVTNSNYQGKVLVIAAVPSLDTSVCSKESKELNQTMTAISPDVEVLVVSRDLPFAQKRWCGHEGASKVRTLSDYKYRSFAEPTGTHWKDTDLLSRAVFVVGRDGKIKYVDYIPELSHEPDYAAVEAAVKAAL